MRGTHGVKYSLLPTEQVFLLSSLLTDLCLIQDSSSSVGKNHSQTWNLPHFARGWIKGNHVTWVWLRYEGSWERLLALKMTAKQKARRANKLCSLFLTLVCEHWKGSGLPGAVKELAEKASQGVECGREEGGKIWVYYTCWAEKAMAPHSSTLAWRIPWTEEPGRLQSMGSQRVGHDWVTSLWLFHFHALEKEMATHSSVLA